MADFADLVGWRKKNKRKVVDCADLVGWWEKRNKKYCGDETRDGESGATLGPASRSRRADEADEADVADEADEQELRPTKKNR